MVGTMLNVFAILSALTVCIDATTLPRLKVIVPAMLAMTNRVTMLGISRWAKEGGSYRTIQRFFNISIKWEKLNWRIICNYSLHADGDFIIAIDETVIVEVITN